MPFEDELWTEVELEDICKEESPKHQEYYDARRDYDTREDSRIEEE